MGTRYAEIADARSLGLGSRAFTDQDVKDLNANLDAASAEADGAIHNQLPDTTFPLTSWGKDLTAAVCKIAVYEFLSVRGLNPEPGSADGNVKDRAKDARAWLTLVAEGKRTLQNVVGSGSSTGGGTPDQPTVESASQRGWSNRGTCHRGGPFVSD